MLCTNNPLSELNIAYPSTLILGASLPYLLDLNISKESIAVSVTHLLLKQY